MAEYLTQKVSSGVLPAVVYYRKFSGQPPKATTLDFCSAAKTSYMATYNVGAPAVEMGSYRTQQPEPQGGITQAV